MRHLKTLNKYFVKYKWHLMGGVVFVAISNLFAIFPAQVIRFAIDFVHDTLSFYPLLDGFANQQEYDEVLSLAVLLFAVLVIVLSLLKGFFMYLMRQSIIVMSRHIEFDLKNDIFQKYQELSMSFYKRNNTGDLMNRISEDVSRVRMYLGPAIMYTINLIVLFVMVIVTMLSVNPTLTFYVLTPLPILGVTIYYVSQMINKRSEKVQAKLSALSTYVQDAFSGIRVIKAYNRVSEREARFGKESTEYKNISLGLTKVDALFMPIMILLIGLSTIFTIYIGGLLTMEGKVSPGNIAEFVIYVNMLTWPVASVGWVTSLVQQAAASQKRINEFLGTPNEIYNPTQDSMEFSGSITFENVSFTYPDSGISALKDVSFDLKPNKSIAILGSTGSGKSTIANLMCRLFDATEGRILVDGRDIREINLDQYRSSIGYVPQEVFLFSDSIRNNIAFGNEVSESNTEAIEQAARDAVVYSNIVDFPEKFDTRLGERGITLSGGQKQRVSIARAIIKKPKVLIFDDCLSAVDTETEEKILSNLRRIMKDRSTVIISHRVSSVKQCDEIIVLDEGRVIERGNHQSLMELKGTYHDVHEKQQLEKEHVVE